MRLLEVGTRGPRGEQRARGAPAPAVPLGGPLDIVMGHGGGRSLKIRSAAPVGDLERLEGNRLRGRLPKWKRVVVMTTAAGGGRRAFVLEPGPEETELTHSPYAVRGRFVVAEKANSPKAADKLWDEAEVG